LENTFFTFFRIQKCDFSRFLKYHVKKRKNVESVIQGRIRFSESETSFSLVSTVLCILLSETKTGFRNHRNHPRTWFRCWNVATPTCLMVCTGRWKLKNRERSALYTV